MELPNSPQNRQRDVFVPKLEIKWNSTQEEANALQVCEKNFACQWDLFITGNATIAIDTLDTESAFMEAVKILGKFEVLGWGLLSQFPPFRYFPIFFIIVETHVSF